MPSAGLIKWLTLWNRLYVFSGKIKLPIVEQIIRDAIEYDSYSTGKRSSKCWKPAFCGSTQLIQSDLYATTGFILTLLHLSLSRGTCRRAGKRGGVRARNIHIDAKNQKGYKILYVERRKNIWRSE